MRLDSAPKHQLWVVLGASQVPWGFTLVDWKWIWLLRLASNHGLRNEFGPDFVAQTRCAHQCLRACLVPCSSMLLPFEVILLLFLRLVYASFSPSVIVWREKMIMQVLLFIVTGGQMHGSIFLADSSAPHHMVTTHREPVWLHSPKNMWINKQEQERIGVCMSRFLKHILL